MSAVSEDDHSFEPKKEQEVECQWFRYRHRNERELHEYDLCG
jgi:hypothetical protein